MKVILLKDVAKVGQRGSITEVTDGYALNFLIARGLAIQATPEKITAHEAAQKREVEAREKETHALTAAIQSLEGARIEIKARATEKGGLYKAITTYDIVMAIKKQMDTQVSEEFVVLPKHIKEVGEHDIIVAFGGTKAKLTLAIVAGA